MTKRTILLDGDINAYQVAASIEVAVNWGDDPEIGVDLWTLHSDEAEGIQKLDDQIAAIQDELEADRVVVALTDTHNFRKDVLPTYKDNRAKNRKPVCLPQMRQHLRDNYEVFERPGLEGDDVLGILATSKRIIPGEKIIVSIDKDMKTLPCLYYRTTHPDDGIVEVTEDEADYWHMFQTLTGDTTDGYKGCPGIGPKKAEAILEMALEEGEPMWDAVVRAYVKAKLSEEEALVQARCARILRAADYNFKKKEPILWTPKEN